MTFQELQGKIDRLKKAAFVSIREISILKWVEKDILELLDLINDELGTGWHQGDNYEFLWDMKTDLCILRENIKNYTINHYFYKKGVL